MRIENESFIDAIKAHYLQNPCRVSSLAFWKTAQLCRESQTYAVRQKGHSHFYAVRDRRLVFYWSSDRQRFVLAPEDIQSMEFLVLHEDYYKRIAHLLPGYQVQESHPMIYDFSSTLPDPYPDEFMTSAFDFSDPQQFREAAALLNRCYETRRHTAETVAEWCKLPVFDPSLWIWVRRRANPEPIGLGISTYQASIRECYLDWIQILPEFQGRGLGQLLVGETIRRAEARSDIIRVTGIADDFYRKCGFKGEETWIILRRD